MPKNAPTLAIEGVDTAGMDRRKFVSRSAEAAATEVSRIKQLELGPAGTTGRHLLMYEVCRARFMTGGGYRLLASGHTLEGSFSAVSTPLFTITYSLCRVFEPFFEIVYIPSHRSIFKSLKF